MAPFIKGHSVPTNVSGKNFVEKVTK